MCFNHVIYFIGVEAKTIIEESRGHLADMIGGQKEGTVTKNLHYPMHY